ncbi:MAG: hypothetical protein WEG36_10980 [Gemmatimonadota bacterium]
MSPTPTSRNGPKPILSAVLEDGVLVETIYRPKTGKTALLRYDRGEISEHDTLSLPRLGRVAPYAATNNLLEHRVLLLPSSATECGTVTELLSEVRAFIHRYADLGDSFEEAASLYVLLSWVYDAFSELPYLRLKGDYGSGKTRCLQTIGSVAYKPMFASGASTVSPLFRMLDSIEGTLVLDESDFRFSDERAEITKILNNGNARGFPVLRSEATPQKEFNPTAFNVFGPKIIATRKSFEDRALESRCITEAMSGRPPRADIPLNLPPAFHEEALEIRNRLLMYRFRMRNALPSVSVAIDEYLEARVAQVFAPLLAVAPDENTRERMRDLARRTSGELSAERSASVEAQVLGIIHEMDRDGVPLRVKDIAARFSERHGSDYRHEVSARWIGAQLRGRLSLTPVKSHGTFVIPDSDRPRLADLYERYSVGGMPPDDGG